MSTTTEGFEGPIILVAHLYAKSDADADQTEILLKAISASANSEAEPDCSTFRVSRFKNDFVVFEKYANAAAVQHHYEQQGFKDLAEAAGRLLNEPPVIKYYQEL